MAPARLSEDEVRELKRWERRLGRAFVGGWVLLVCAFVVSFVLGAAGLGPALFALVVLFLGAVAVLHVARHCPRCGCRFGLYTRMSLPPHCPRCGVSFQR
jgi:hypothetical protein